MKSCWPPRFFPYFILSTLSLAVAAIFRYGLLFGVSDQITYSLWGIRMTDPSAFANDWTVDHMVMPHWSYDWVTYFGESIGQLEWVYRLYWGCGVMALAAGLVLLNARINPAFPGAAILAGPLLVLGPISLAGSTTPVLGIAIPHYLGGSLVILGLGLLANGIFRWALIIGMMAIVTHVQHGLNFGLILLIAGAFLRGRERMTAWGGGVVLVAAALLISQRPGLVGSFADLLRMCRDFIPFHCYAPSWNRETITYPYVYFALAGILIWSVIRRDFVLATVSVVPALVIAVSIAVDFYSIPLLGDLARGTNSYRFITLFYPIVVLAILSGLTSRSLWMSAVGFFLLGAWLLGPSSHYQFSSGRALEVALLLLLAMRWIGSGVYGQLLLAIAGASTAALYFNPIMIGPDAAMVEAGRQIQRHVPVGETVIAEPSLMELRLHSRRAVIAEAKTHPFGEPALSEWENRMRDLGGYDFSPRSFRRLGFERLEQLSVKYNAHFVVLNRQDPKLEEALKRWGPGISLPANLTLFHME